MPPRNTKTEQELVDRVLKDFDACKGWHNEFVSKAKKRYNAYRGFLDLRSNEKLIDWRSNLHPPYVGQQIESMVSAMIEDQLYFAVRPQPYAIPNAQEAEAIYEGARVLESYLRMVDTLDEFPQKQRPWMLQNSITGYTVTKTFWNYEEGMVRRLEQGYVDEYDDYERFTGFRPTLIERELNGEVLADDPSVEIVDVLDFFFPIDAKSIKQSPYVIHRVWMYPHEVAKLAKLGVYKNTEGLADTGHGVEDRETFQDTLFVQMREKGLIEVLEWWSDDQVISVGNRSVCIREQRNPFWHQRKPFTATSSLPDLFRIPGISDVELIVDVQKALWDLMNQRHDNLKLLANAIVLIASDVDDPDDFVFAPMERWLVEHPDQVKTLEMTSMPAEITLSAEARLMGDIQNLPGGLPFAAGAESTTMDQKTATGVSIITSIAQKRVQTRKQNFLWAMGQINDQRISLAQQFIRDERLIPMFGPDNTASFHKLLPLGIQHRYRCVVEAMGESMMRQERRAEAQALLSLANQSAPVFAQSGIPLNLKAFMDKFLREFGEHEPERFYLQPGGAPQGMGGAQGPPPPGQEQEFGPNMGTTAETAVDASSPSATGGISMSPVAAQSRFAAAGGGAMNAPV